MTAPTMAGRSRSSARPGLLRPLAFTMLLLLTVQLLAGMAVNLFFQIPKHPGSGAPFLPGIVEGVPWAIGHSWVWLSVHAALGLLLCLGSLALLALAIAARSATWIASTFFAAWGMVGAGLNGVSFLDYGRDYSSLLMALGFAMAIAGYGAALFATRR